MEGEDLLENRFSMKKMKPQRQKQQAHVGARLTRDLAPAPTTKSGIQRTSGSLGVGDARGLGRRTPSVL